MNDKIVYFQLDGKVAVRAIRPDIVNALREAGMKEVDENTYSNSAAGIEPLIDDLISNHRAVSKVQRAVNWIQFVFAPRYAGEVNVWVTDAVLDM